MASPEKVPDNKQRDLITRFNDAYRESLTIAHVHAEHTRTDGWKQLYQDTRKSHGDVGREVAKSLRELADTIESIGSDEDLEKQIGECKKRAEQNRKDRDSFNRQVVEPVKAPSLESAAIIEKFRSQARRDEQDTPLVNMGLAHLMQDAIAAVPKVEWDEEFGTITVKEPAEQP